MTKNIAIGILSAAFAFAPLIGFAQTNTTIGTVSPVTVTACPYSGVTARPGTSSSDVKALQSLLSQDPSIYPQGLVTGYFGTLTQEAVKNLQRKFGLPETGTIDENTRPYIFPCFSLRVTSPNGGESWKVGETHSITWESDAPYILKSTTLGGAARISEKALPSGATELPSNAAFPIFRNLSIDLIRYDVPQVMTFPAPVYYHIGSANLYTDSSLSWTIPSSIAESQMYKVRISFWRDVPEPFECKTRPCPLVPQSDMYPIRWQGYLWDESDNYFAITGGATVSPLPLTTPNYGKLQELRTQLMQALESIQKAISVLDQLLTTTPSAR